MDMSISWASVSAHFPATTNKRQGTTKTNARFIESGTFYCVKRGCGILSVRAQTLHRRLFADKAVPVPPEPKKYITFKAKNGGQKNAGFHRHKSRQERQAQRRWGHMLRG
jgi:hypothetical protein